MTSIPTTQNQKIPSLINQLPKEVLELICCYNEFWDQVTLSRTSKVWREVLNTPRLEFTQMHNQIQKEELLLRKIVHFPKKLISTEEPVSYMIAGNIRSPIMPKRSSLLHVTSRPEPDDEQIYRVSHEINKWLQGAREDDIENNMGKRSLFDLGYLTFRKNRLQLRQSNSQTQPLTKADLPVDAFEVPKTPSLDSLYDRDKRATRLPISNPFNNINSKDFLKLLEPSEIKNKLTYKISLSHLKLPLATKLPLESMISTDLVSIQTTLKQHLPEFKIPKLNLEELILVDNRPWIVRTAESIFNKTMNLFK